MIVEIEMTDFQELLKTITQTVLIPLLIALTGFAVKWINAKANEIKADVKDKKVQKYISMLNDTIVSAVIAVNQTYVDALKEQNAFTPEAQKEAFNRVYETIIATMTEEADIYLQEAIGDLEEYITTKIEEAVKENKMPKVIE
jgi:hypothetical protein